MNRFIISLVLVVAVMSLTACGGGGGGGGAAAAQPTKAIVKISTTGTLPGGTLIGGIDVTVSLPTGVSAKSTVTPPETDAGVVVASGLAAGSSLLTGKYTPPSGGTHAQARLLLVNAGGFGVGEFATVNGDIATGYNPTAADFTVTSLTVVDVTGTPIAGLSVSFAVSTQ